MRIWGKTFPAAAGLATVLCVATLLAGPSLAAARTLSGTPVDFTFKASPHTFSDKGGTTTLSATFKNVVKCSIAVTPRIANVNSTVSCTSGKFSKAVAIPADKTGTPIDYSFSIKLTGSPGSGVLEPAAVVVGVGAAPPPLTLTFGTVGANSFGDEGVSVTSAPVAISVRNAANTSQTIETLAIIGTDSGDFSVNLGSNCLTPAGTPNQLTPGQTCTVNVTFTPRGSGSRRAVLQVVDSSWGVNGTSALEPLNGTGVFASVSFGEDSVSMNPAGTSGVGVSTTSPPVLVTMTDEIPEGGTGVTLAIGQIYTESEDAANFKIYQDNCSNSFVTPGTSCVFSILFTPGQPGVRTTDIVVPDNTADSESVLPVSGTGVDNNDSTLSISDAVVSSFSTTGSIDYYAAYGATPVGCTPGSTCADQVITITNSNTDGIVLYIGAPSVIGTNPVDFLVDNDGCIDGTYLAPDAACSFDIMFRPIATGARYATLDLPVNSAGTAYLALNLAGNDPPA
ncbi:MAG: choice-of-anchor D domain-containing protein [Acidimicrobiales bacterium]